MNTAVKFVSEALLKQGLEYLTQDPARNIVNLLNWAELLPIRETEQRRIQVVRQYVADPDSNWHHYVVKLLQELHPNVRDKFIINFFLNSVFFGLQKQTKLAAKYGINIPWAILIDPTARCNLRCTGCWAADYHQQDELDYALLDRVIREAKELGIYMIIFSGGEPLLRKADLIKLASVHQDVAFLSFTNGLLVDDQFVADLVQVGNLALAFSIEGFAATTDGRRGKGVYDRIIQAMDKLHAAGLLFGFSATYTRENVAEVASDAFIDDMIRKGCRFGWYFTYVPVGGDVNLELMATPEQRAYMWERVKYFRRTKPIFALDFWNDGEATQGCIAGGRKYFHINAAGAVEPCDFVHYSNCNIKDTSLLDALHSPLFRAYRQRQPFNANHLRPCPLIDNPEQLAAMVAQSGAYSTQVGEAHAVNTVSEALQEYAAAWGELADRINPRQQP